MLLLSGSLRLRLKLLELLLGAGFALAIGFDLAGLGSSFFLLFLESGYLGFQSFGSLTGGHDFRRVYRVSIAHKSGPFGLGLSSFGLGSFGSLLTLIGYLFGLALILRVSDGGTGKGANSGSNKCASRSKVVLAANSSSYGCSTKTSHRGSFFRTGACTFAAA
jgi:hypothetical protein